MASNYESKIRNALIDNYNAYAEGLDSKNWDKVRSCFCDRVHLDYGDLSEALGGPGKEIEADLWIPALQSVINGFDITRHTITNHRFVIDGQLVRCQAYLIADHVIWPEAGENHLGAGDVVTVIGEYTNEYQLVESHWKICRSRLVMNYTTGNLELMGVAVERAARAAG